MKKLLLTLTSLLFIALSIHAESVIITSSRGGEIADEQKLTGKENITDLVVSGIINQKDLKEIGKVLQNLERLNLKDATFEKYFDENNWEDFSANKFPTGLNGHTNLQYLELPPSITTISNDALVYCNALETLVVHATTPPEIDYWSLTDNATYQRCSLYVVAEAVDAYNGKKSEGWKFKEILPISPISSPVNNDIAIIYHCSQAGQRIKINTEPQSTVKVLFPDNQVKSVVADEDGIASLYYSIKTNQVADAANMKVQIECKKLLGFSAENTGITTFEIINADPKFKRLSLTYQNINNIDLSAIIGSIRNLNLAGNANLSQIDITGAKKLTSIDIANTGITTINGLEECLMLQRLVAFNSKLANIDASPFTNLTELDLANTGSTSVIVEKNVNLEILYLSDNQLTSVNIAPLTNLYELYLANNQLESIDIKSDKLEILDVANNKLTRLDISASPNISTLYCNNNHISLSALPTFKPKTSPLQYIYAPQAIWTYPEKKYNVGDKIDLSSEASLQGITDQMQPSTYTWYNAKNNTPLTENDVRESSTTKGIFEFLNSQPDSVYVVISSEAFPEFKERKIFKSHNIIIERQEEAAVTFITDNPKQTFTVKTDPEAVVKVRFPDGYSDEKKADAENGLARFAHNIATESIQNSSSMLVQIFCDNTLSFTAQNTGIQSFNILQAPALKRISLSFQDIRDINISSVANTLTELYLSANRQLTSIDLTGCSKLEWLNIANSPVEELTGLADCSALQHFIAYNTHIGNININKMVNLIELDLTNIQCNNIDLSNNTSLETLLIGDNELTSIDLAPLTQLKKLNIADNKIENIDIQATGLEQINVARNNLRILNLTHCTNIKSIACEGNKLSLDQLPVFKRKYPADYTYAPQQRWDGLNSTYKTGEVIDLSSMDMLQGILDKKVKSKVTWINAENYEPIFSPNVEEDPNKSLAFIFKEAQNLVYCEISTPAFPDFIGRSIFRSIPIQIILKGAIEEVISSVKAFRSGNNIYISAEEPTSYMVYTLKGETIHSNTISSGENITLEVPDDTVILFISSNGKTVAKKL